jgi:hypothetical protein
MFNLNAFNQNRVVDSLQHTNELKLHTNWGITIPKTIKQVHTSSNKIKAISNFDNGRLIYYYEIQKSKGLFNRFYEIETVYSYDSLLRLVCIKTVNDISIEKDTIHYNKLGRIDFYEVSHKYKTKRHHQLHDYTSTYNVINHFDTFYELIDTSYFNDTFQLNLKNEVINSDSIVISIINDTLVYSIFGKPRNYNLTMKKKEYLFVKDKIQIEKLFHRGMYKVDSTQTNYFYEEGKLSVIKKDNSRFLNYQLLYYGWRGFLEREVNIISTYNKTISYYNNHSYYNKIIHKKEDLKSMF